MSSFFLARSEGGTNGGMMSDYCRGGSSQTKDKQQSCPFQAAKCATLRQTRLLLNLYPEVATRRDVLKENKLPLHHVLERCCGAGDGSSSTQGRGNGGGSSSSSRRGSTTTPNNWLELVQEWYNAYPEGTVCQDLNGRTPFQTLLKSLFLPPKVTTIVRDGPSTTVFPRRTGTDSSSNSSMTDEEAKVIRFMFDVTLEEQQLQLMLLSSINKEEDDSLFLTANTDMASQQRAALTNTPFHHICEIVSQFPRCSPSSNNSNNNENSMSTHDEDNNNHQQNHRRGRGSHSRRRTTKKVPSSAKRDGRTSSSSSTSSSLYDHLLELFRSRVQMYPQALFVINAQGMTPLMLLIQNVPMKFYNIERVLETRLQEMLDQLELRRVQRDLLQERFRLIHNERHLLQEQRDLLQERDRLLHNQRDLLQERDRLLLGGRRGAAEGEMAAAEAEQPQEEEQRNGEEEPPILPPPLLPLAVIPRRRGNDNLTVLQQMVAALRSRRRQRANQLEDNDRMEPPQDHAAANDDDDNDNDNDHVQQEERQRRRSAAIERQQEHVRQQMDHLRTRLRSLSRKIVDIQGCLERIQEQHLNNFACALLIALPKFRDQTTTVGADEEEDDDDEVASSTTTTTTNVAAGASSTMDEDNDTDDDEDDEDQEDDEEEEEVGGQDNDTTTAAAAAATASTVVATTNALVGPTFSFHNEARLLQAAYEGALSAILMEMHEEDEQQKQQTSGSKSSTSNNDEDDTVMMEDHSTKNSGRRRGRPKQGNKKKNNTTDSVANKRSTSSTFTTELASQLAQTAHGASCGSTAPVFACQFISLFGAAFHHKDWNNMIRHFLEQIPYCAEDRGETDDFLHNSLLHNYLRGLRWKHEGLQHSILVRSLSPRIQKYFYRQSEGDDHHPSDDDKCSTKMGSNRLSRRAGRHNVNIYESDEMPSSSLLLPSNLARSPPLSTTSRARNNNDDGEDEDDDKKDKQSPQLTQLFPNLLVQSTILDHSKNQSECNEEEENINNGKIGATRDVDNDEFNLLFNDNTNHNDDDDDDDNERQRRRTNDIAARAVLRRAMKRNGRRAARHRSTNNNNSSTSPFSSRLRQQRLQQEETTTTQTNKTPNNENHPILSIMETLIKVKPDMAHNVNKRGELPLHMALKCIPRSTTNTTTTATTTSSQLVPTTTTKEEEEDENETKEENWDLMLHDMVKFLVTTNPNSCWMTDPTVGPNQGRSLYPFMLASLGGGVTLLKEEKKNNNNSGDSQEQQQQFLDRKPSAAARHPSFASPTSVVPFISSVSSPVPETRSTSNRNKRGRGRKRKSVAPTIPKNKKPKCTTTSNSNTTNTITNTTTGGSYRLNSTYYLLQQFISSRTLGY